MGIPLLDIMPQLNSQSIVVAELSCHQLENIHRAPHISILLNLYQEHLDHYHSYLDYQMAKMQIMLRQESTDHCFYCTDSPDLYNLVNKLHVSPISNLHPYSIQQARQSSIAQISTVLKGDHNLSNIYVARQVTQLFGVTDDQFAMALESFHGLPHRLELVGTYNDITFYNDSISTIPEAAIAAIEALSNVDTLILGGFDRGIDYTPLIDYLANPSKPGSRIAHLVFVGEAGRRMYQEWKLSLPTQSIFISDDYSAIVQWCFQHTQPGKICLLSPAAASYDAFRNFEHRGDTFKNLITSAANNISIEHY